MDSRSRPQVELKPPQRSGQRFVQLLKSEMDRRIEKNPRYSLRAFAKLLQVSPSYLCMLFSGKRQLNEKMLMRFCHALALVPQEVAKQQVYLRVEKGAHSGSDEKNSYDSQYSPLSLDQFSAISDWTHYTIWEILRLKDFVPNTKWVAGALGVPEYQVTGAVERLQKLGLLKIDEEGRWHCMGSFTNIDQRVLAAGKMRLQKKILEQSLEALENIPIELRDHTSMTMSVHADRLPGAIDMIKKFRRQLCAYLEHGDGPSEVYQMQISLFPVTDVSTPDSKR